MKRALKVTLKSDLSGWGKVEGLTETPMTVRPGVACKRGSRRAVYLALGETERAACGN